MTEHALVIGAGWAGLAAAVALTRGGRAVTLIEAGREPGGRARRVHLDELPVDNGQHLLLGAYASTLDLLRTLGVAEHEVLTRLPLALDLRGAHGRRIHLQTPALPAPLHLLWGLMHAQGIARADRLRALRGLPAMLRFPGCEDMTVAGLLARHGQPRSIVDGLWTPLCLGALNLPPEEASAGVFVRVLRESFDRRRAHSDLLVARRDLGAVLPAPALAFLRAHGTRSLLGERVTGLLLERGRIAGVRTRKGEQRADTVVLATGPRAAADLLAAHPSTAALAADIRALGAAPICTVYMQYAPQTSLPRPLLGLLEGPGQWVFDRGHTGQPGLMSVVISGPGPHMELSNETLAQSVARQLQVVLGWPLPHRHWVIREKHATIRCTPQTERLRPPQATAIRGLWLAGDYTRTGLPATLEGAVRSGLECARTLLQSPAPATTT